MVLNFDSRKFLKGLIKPLKVAVWGSRTLKDERVKTIILEKLIELQATCIVTSKEPEGVCEVAQQIAQHYGYPLELHFLNLQYLRGAFEQRSLEILQSADCFILIHDGVSKGTANEKALVEKSGKPMFYVVLEPSEHSRSVGFEIKQEWGGNTNW